MSWWLRPGVIFGASAIGGLLLVGCAVLVTVRRGHYPEAVR
jgi:hypothetical protein